MHLNLLISRIHLFFCLYNPWFCKSFQILELSACKVKCVLNEFTCFFEVCNSLRVDWLLWHNLIHLICFQSDNKVQASLEVRNAESFRVFNLCNGCELTLNTRANNLDIIISLKIYMFAVWLLWLGFHHYRWIHKCWHFRGNISGGSDKTY